MRYFEMGIKPIIAKESMNDVEDGVNQGLQKVVQKTTKLFPPYQVFEHLNFFRVRRVMVRLGYG